MYYILVLLTVTQKHHVEKNDTVEERELDICSDIFRVFFKIYFYSKDEKHTRSCQFLKRTGKASVRVKKKMGRKILRDR